MCMSVAFSTAMQTQLRVIAALYPRQRTVTSRVAWANRPMPDTLKPSDYFSVMAREVIASQLIWNCLTAKHNSFSNEREVRYIIMGIISKFDPHRKHFNSKAYVETPLPLKTAGSIMEILVGPYAPADAEAVVSNCVRERSGRSRSSHGRSSDPSRRNMMPRR